MRELTSKAYISQGDFAKGAQALFIYFRIAEKEAAACEIAGSRTPKTSKLSTTSLLQFSTIFKGSCWTLFEYCEATVEFEIDLTLMQSKIQTISLQVTMKW